MATTHLKNYIDGRWLDSSSGDAFEDTDPANGDIIATATKSTTADVDKAVEAARRAYDSWRLFPAPKRGEILYRAGEIMLTRKDDLAREMTLEMGKVLAESKGDVQEGIDMTYYIAGEGRRQFGDVVPAELPNKWAMSMRNPHGVIAAITPWNFPFAIPTWKIMPALVLGNTVVFKPASYTPMLAVRLVEILEQAGLPKGVLNLVLGPGGALGDHLVQHPSVDLISFTGSSDTGSHISEIAGRLLKRVSAELGGKNAIVVLDDADVDLALDLEPQPGAEGSAWRRRRCAEKDHLAPAATSTFADLGNSVMYNHRYNLKRAHEGKEMGQLDWARDSRGGGASGADSARRRGRARRPETHPAARGTRRHAQAAPQAGGSPSGDGRRLGRSLGTSTTPGRSWSI